MAGPMRRLPRWLDRAGFEADKLMRANRVRSEATRLREQADVQMQALAEKAIELSSAGTELPPELQELVTAILGVRSEIDRKEEEIKAINAEQWLEPAPPPAPAAVPSAAPVDPISQRLQAYVDARSSDFTCPKCGAVVRNGKSFCPSCGRRVIR